MRQTHQRTGAFCTRGTHTDAHASLPDSMPCAIDPVAAGVPITVVTRFLQLVLFPLCYVPRDAISTVCNSTRATFCTPLCVPGLDCPNDYAPQSPTQYSGPNTGSSLFPCSPAARRAPNPPPLSCKSNIEVPKPYGNNTCCCSDKGVALARGVLDQWDLGWTSFATG